MTATTSKKILVVDDEKNICWVLRRLFSQKNFIVDEAYTGKEALEKINSNSYDLIFMDIIMPDILGLDVLAQIKSLNIQTPVIVMTAQSTMKNAVEAMKRGAFEYITKPFDITAVEKLADRAIKSYEQTHVSKAEDKKVKGSVDEESIIVGNTPVMNEIFKTIGKIADSDITVLIQGERGTGKELVARAIHNSGKRASQHFISVNCAAIPKELLESELFGYEKGAFTGAVERKIGKFELAHNGTLFLDEIGDMPIDLQAKILRVIEEKEIVPVGGNKPINVDVRIIAATNQDLLEMIKNKAFRADLYDRLNQIPLFLPPLRERYEDIPLLARHFLKNLSKEYGNKKTISEDALNFLKSYSWPGNVRELLNAVKRAYLISRSTVLERQDFLFLTHGVAREEMMKELSLEEIVDWKLNEFMRLLQDGEMTDVYDFVVSQVEKPLIKKILLMTGGNQIRAAKILGLNRNTLRKKIATFGLEVKELKKNIKEKKRKREQ